VFLLIWQTLGALQLFDLVFATTQGGPLGSTTVVVYFVYDQAFRVFDAGYGAAAAYVLAAAILALNLVLFGLMRLRRPAAGRGREVQAAQRGLRVRDRRRPPEPVGHPAAVPADRAIRGPRVRRARGGDIPPANAKFDYQIGAPYPPPAGVG
jgi:hypothetical protein